MTTIKIQKKLNQKYFKKNEILKLLDKYKDNVYCVHQGRNWSLKALIVEYINCTVYITDSCDWEIFGEKKVIGYEITFNNCPTSVINHWAK